METKTMRVLSIGAHPDDADTSAGGLLEKLRRKGWEVRLLSVTDGSAGTYHMDMGGKPLADIRRKEAERSGRIFGGQYDVMDAKHLAEALQISKAGAYNLLSSPDFPTLRIGGRKLVMKNELVEWLKSRTNKTS